MVEQGAQRVISSAQEDVSEWEVGRRHVLGQEVVFHLNREGGQVEVGACSSLPSPSELKPEQQFQTKIGT